MTQPTQLTLVLPDALAQLRAQRLNDAAISPFWRRFLQTAQWQRLWAEDDAEFTQLEAWQHAVLQALPSALRPAGLAAAALTWRGQGGAMRRGTWLQADWVHMAAGLDDVRLAPIDDLNAEDETALLATVQPVLSMGSFEWLGNELSRTGGFIWSERPMDLITHAPRQGFTTRNYAVMPQGAHGAQLRRIMTELQMVLHPHPLNAQRERQRKLPVNALWLWGAGRLDAVNGKAPRLLGNHPYLVGLAEHFNQPCWPLPQRAQDVLAVRGDAVVLLPKMSLEEAEQTWLKPLWLALEQGEITNLVVHFDHWRAMHHGGRWHQLRRYVRRASHELTEILA